MGALLGRLGALLSRLGAFLGASWTVLGRFWGPLGRRRRCQDETGELQNMHVFQCELDDFCLLGPSRQHSWAVLAASWAILERRGAALGRLDTLFDCLRALSGSSGTVLGLFGGSGGPGGALTSSSPPKRILDPRGGGKVEGDSQMSHTPFQPRQAGVGGCCPGRCQAIVLWLLQTHGAGTARHAAAPFFAY